MTSRRGSQPTHVRPRPPSSGRPAPVKVRPRAPAPGRLAVHTPIRRTRGIPFLGRVALAVAVVAMGFGVLYVGAGGLGTVATSLGATFGGFIEGVTATPIPSATPVVISDAPSIESPSEPYTRTETVDLVVTVPQNVSGDPDYRLRVYLALEDQASAPIQEASLSAGPRNIIPVALTKGINDFTVTVVGPGGESEASPVVRYVLDQSKPSLKLTSHKDGAIVNAKAVKLTGKTQARSTVTAKNTTTGDSLIATANSDGLFTVSLPLTTGSNQIQLVSVDPAGNEKTLKLDLRRGSGKLQARVSASSYRFKRGSLPSSLRLTATITDPDGKALGGAIVTFTLSIPGIPTVTEDVRTGSNGRAVWRTSIPSGADTGPGIAAVSVTSEEHGRATDSAPITITK
ncbi:MAG TPA: Ig-like domain-containing protein [Candidatus Saccharimonadales bacterium]|nr:Ig-like domain-containing protein [Candidatus Saccharimonadales bacterium]